MEIKKGLVVKAKTGRDKDDFFVVIGFENNFAYICNGKNRSLEKPKKKNIKHLSVTKTVLCEENVKSNKRIKKSLFKYKRK